MEIKCWVKLVLLLFLQDSRLKRWNVIVTIFQSPFSTATTRFAQNPARPWGQQRRSNFPPVSKKEPICSEIWCSTLDQLSVCRKASARWQCSMWSMISGAQWAFGLDYPPTQSSRCCSLLLLLGETRRWPLSISTMLTYLPMLQYALFAWATGKMGRVLSLLFATLVTLVLLALGGVFIYISLDAWKSGTKQHPQT